MRGQERAAQAVDGTVPAAAAAPPVATAVIISFGEMHGVLMKDFRGRTPGSIVDAHRAKGERFVFQYDLSFRLYGSGTGSALGMLLNRVSFPQTIRLHSFSNSVLRVRR